jgi:hypothetical protein
VLFFPVFVIILIDLRKVGTIWLTLPKSLCFLTNGRSAIDALLRKEGLPRKIDVEMGQSRPCINSYAKNIQEYGVAAHICCSNKFSNPDERAV